jgi:hypothetical protein
MCFFVFAIGDRRTDNGKSPLRGFAERFLSDLFGITGN